MRPLIGIALLVLAAIGLALFASRLHPGGELPPNEILAQQDQEAADKKKAEADARKALVDHSSGAFDAVKAGAVHATLVFDGKAPLQIELYPAAAPKTVEHISSLIKKGFYNGIKVHRLENGSSGPSGQPGLNIFQFGDPHSVNVDPADFTSKRIGSNGSGTTVPLEVKLPDVKYSIGMARGPTDDSGDSQMFINTEDNPNLDGDYCIFGRVVSGQNVVSTIKVGDAIKSFTIP
jgi:peptidyl-prolyl cis-trans isomerase B (cyclophilin B)